MISVVSARVNITDQDDAPLAGATILGHWTPPSGATVWVIADTDSSGQARFSITGRTGTYTFTIDDVEFTGYTYDRANSEVSESITP
jgi:hypothetical protein